MFGRRGHGAFGGSLAPVFAMALLGLAPVAARAVVELRTVALSGQPAPGLGEGTTLSSLGRPFLDGAGRVTFTSFLEGPDVDASNDRGLWSDRSGELALEARRGDPAPGTPEGVRYASFVPFLDEAGELALEATLQGPGVGSSSDRGLWAERDGALVLVAREGDEPPEVAPGVTYEEIEEPVFSDAGRFAFQARLSGPGVTPLDSRGIWSEGSGALSLVARGGQPAPDTAPGVSFEELGLNVPTLNAGGETAFRGLLSGPGITDENERGLWSGSDDGLSLVAREGQAAPGTPAGTVFDRFGLPTLSAAGRVALQADLRGPDVTSQNEQGVWSEGGGALDLVARAGEPAPGAPPGVDYLSFDTPPINSSGQVAFRAFLGGPGVNNLSNEAIFGPDGSDVTLFFREGEPAPRVPAGVLLDSFDPPVLDDTGGILVTASLRGSGVDGRNDLILYYADATSGPVAVVRTGRFIEVLPGDFRRLQFFDLSDARSQRQGRRSLNDRREIALFAAFTDGSSAILVATVPEPSTLVLCAAGLGLLARRSACAPRRARRP